MEKTVLHTKLRETGGSSILLALLVMLVCIVVASVIVTAGTVAGGRMAQMQQTDQRYYSVNSAAHLLVDNMNGQSVSIVRETQTPFTTTKTIDPKASPTTTVVGPTDDEDHVTTKYYFAGAAEADKKTSLGDLTGDDVLSAAAIAFANGEWVQGGSGAAVTKSYEFQPSATGLQTAALKVNMQVAQAADGSLTITLTSPKATGSNDAFKMVLTLEAEVNAVSSSSETTNTPVITDLGGGKTQETQTGTRSETDTLTITWTVGSLEQA